jgi:hypothetical protein
LRKKVSTKINAIFLTVVLIAGTFVLMSPSFMRGAAQAEPGYEMNNEKPKYPSYKPDNNYYKFEDSSSSISIKKVNCNNVNLNVNDASVNVGRPPLGDTTSLETSGTEGQEITTANNFANGERNNNNNGFKKDNDGFVYVCINNNNNEQAGETPTPPPEELANLNVIKTVECESTSGEPDDEAVCNYVEANLLPGLEDYEMTVTGNSPDPSEFPGSSTGTNVQLGEGNYEVTEVFPSDILSDIQTELSAQSVTNTAVVGDGSDCDQIPDPNNIFVGASGTISPGESQTCIIENTVKVFTEKFQWISK